MGEHLAAVFDQTGQGEIGAVEAESAHVNMGFNRASDAVGPVRVHESVSPMMLCVVMLSGFQFSPHRVARAAAWARFVALMVVRRFAVIRRRCLSE